MKDNLFDKEFTILDVVKILLLVVTAFSTWNVIDLMTPDGSLAFIRELAALGVVEGAFLGFEMATAKAKSRRQTKFATIGFFCSLVVIGLFAGVSGLLEFGGPELLAQSMGVWLGITWLMKDVVMVSSLVTLVVWIVTLAALYRLYSLNDPDKKAELDRIELDEEVTEESNTATRIALQNAQPTIASARARAHVKAKYTGEVGLAEMDKLLKQVDTCLQENYGLETQSLYDAMREGIADAQDTTLDQLRSPADLIASGLSGDEPHYHPMTKLVPMGKNGNGNGNFHKPQGGAD